MQETANYVTTPLTGITLYNVNDVIRHIWWVEERLNLEQRKDYVWFHRIWVGIGLESDLRFHPETGVQLSYNTKTQEEK